MTEKRRLVYDFIMLPHVAQVQIMSNLGLPYVPKLSDQEQRIKWFKALPSVEALREQINKYAVQH